MEDNHVSRLNGPRHDVELRAVGLDIREAWKALENGACFVGWVECRGIEQRPSM